MINPLFTIGHSNHSPKKFSELLQEHGITALVDVRSAPYSRYLPHFNKPSLQNLLSEIEIHYVFLGAELGARPDDPSCCVNSKALYEKIASTKAFDYGIQRVYKGIQSHRIALMCAEKDPITCHRAVLVCQHLVPFNLEIGHIHSNGKLEYHEDLEERMLALHHLQDTFGAKTGQLNLFIDKPIIIRNRNERIQKAYQKQGTKNAYLAITD